MKTDCSAAKEFIFFLMGHSTKEDLKTIISMVMASKEDKIMHSKELSLMELDQKVNSNGILRMESTSMKEHLIIKINFMEKVSIK